MNNSKIKKYPILTYLLYLLLVSVLFTGVTFSRYTMSTSGGASVPLARFSCTYEVDDISSQNFPNIAYWLTSGAAASTSRSIRFTMRNYELENGAEAVSEVDVDGYVTFRLPAEMADNLALQLAYVNEAGGTYNNVFTHEIVISQLVYSDPKTKTYANYGTDGKFDTSNFSPYYNAGVGKDDGEGEQGKAAGLIDENLAVTGSLQPVKGDKYAVRTITVSSPDGSKNEPLYMEISAQVTNTSYAIGFQRGESENDYSAQLYLDLEEDIDYYTIRMRMPQRMHFKADVEQHSQFVMFISLTDMIDDSDFEYWWQKTENNTPVYGEIATTGTGENAPTVAKNSDLINCPPQNEAGAYYLKNGAKIVGWHFNQDVEYYVNDQGKVSYNPVEGYEKQEHTVRVTCAYDYDGGYDLTLQHIAPISVDSSSSFVHDMTFVGKDGPVSSVSFNVSDGVPSDNDGGQTFRDIFKTGKCSNNVSIDLSHLVISPLLDKFVSEATGAGTAVYSMYKVLSKSYDVSFRGLFVQASQLPAAGEGGETA